MRKLKTSLFTILLLTIGTSLFFFGCANAAGPDTSSGSSTTTPDSSTDKEEEQKVEFKITSDKSFLVESQEAELTVSYTDGTKVKDITWTNDNPDVIEMPANVKANKITIKAKKNGTAVITAEEAETEKTTTYTVKVTDAYINVTQNGVAVTDTVTMDYNGSVKLNYSIESGKLGKSVPDVNIVISDVGGQKYTEFFNEVSKTNNSITISALANKEEASPEFTLKLSTIIGSKTVESADIKFKSNAKPVIPPKPEPEPEQPEPDTPEDEHNVSNHVVKRHNYLRTDSEMKEFEKDFKPETIEFIKDTAAQASNRIYEVFPKTFGHLENARIGIGLTGTNSTDEMERYAAVIFGPVKHGGRVTNEFTLNISLANFGQTSEHGILNESGKKLLKENFAHEIMHAMMGEALTAGMSGDNINPSNKTPGFMTWFKEGMAVSTGGVGEHLGGFSLTDETSASSDLKSHYLGNTKTDSYYVLYGSGYLASMYLGYAVYEYTNNHNILNGNINESNITINNLRSGLDTLMSTIAQGYSLLDAINILTGKHYTMLYDEKNQSYSEERVETCFADDFTKNGAKFCVALNTKRNGGLGSLLDDSLDCKDHNFYVNNFNKTPIFEVNSKATKVDNYYPVQEVTVNGGSLEVTGFDRDGGYPANAKSPKVGDRFNKIDNLKPYRKFSNTKITINLQINSGEELPQIIIPEIEGAYQDEKHPALKTNIIWYKGNFANGNSVTGTAEKGQSYTAKIVITPQAYFSEGSSTKYSNEGRFIENNKVFINSEEITNGVVFPNSGRRLEITKTFTVN